MVQPGAPAPDFTLPGLDGLDYALHEALGKGPALLAFWQKDCGTCKLPAAGAAGFVRQYAFRPTVLVDGPALGVSRIYDPDATPTLYLIEPEAGVTLVSAGFVKDELNEISRRIAQYAGAAYVEVAPADDGNPPFKPG
ncbi:MAG: TlpA family protein disulfide reductase [Dehalococcoidia bacterium]